MQIQTRNDGQEIVDSNYWASEYARQGVLWLSVNCGAFRLLVPKVHEPLIGEMADAKDIIVSSFHMGPNGEASPDDAIQIVFDDKTADPYRIDLTVKQLDRPPGGRQDDGRRVPFTVWVNAGGQPTRVLRQARSRLSSLRPSN